MSHYEITQRRLGPQQFYDGERGIGSETRKPLITAAIIGSVGAVAAAGVGAASAAADRQAAGKLASDAAHAPVYNNLPWLDPVLNATSLEALLGLGQSNAGLTGQGSPASMIYGIAQQLGLGDITDALNVALYHGQYAQFDNSHDTQQNIAKINQALRAAGFNNPQELMAAQKAWEANRSKTEAQLGPLREQILQGRMAAYGGISKMAQDFPSASLGDINALAAQYEAQIRSGIRQDVGDQTDAILQAANMNRGNPAATLGRLSQQELLSRQAAPTTALERALQMLQGRQTLGSNAITAYQSVLDPANTYALNVANLRTNAAGNAAQLMSGQQQNANNLQASLGMQGANNYATGMTNAGNTLASGASSIAQMYQNQALINALTNKGISGSTYYGPGSTQDTTGMYFLPRSTI